MKKLGLGSREITIRLFFDHIIYNQYIILNFIFLIVQLKILK